MRWILIFAIYFGNGHGGTAITHVQFSSKLTCEAAGKVMETELRRGNWTGLNSRWVCVEDYVDNKAVPKSQ